MSVKAMGWVWDLEDLNTGQAMVLLILADMANDRGYYCWPGQEELARKARMTVRNVRRHLAFLEEQGLVLVERRSSTGGRKSNQYFLNVGMDWHLVSAGQMQPDNLSPCGADLETTPVDNSHSRRSDATGQVVPLRAQPDMGVLPQEDVGVRLPPHSVLNRNCEPPDQTRPAREPVSDPPGRDGRVGSGPVGGDSSSRGGAPSAPAARLVAECLPEWMQALDADGARAVGALLAERVGAGWRPSEICQTMGDRPAGGVTRMAGLVCSRLRRNVDPALAPARLRAEAEAVREVRRRPQEVPAQPVDPQFEAALAWAEREHPEASRWERVRLAEHRLAAVRGGESA